MAIDPKLVSIIPASQLPTGDPTNAADFLFYEGDALKKGSMSNIYEKITSGIKGTATQSNAPTVYTPEAYPNGLFETYVVRTPLTMPNSWGSAVTQVELDANYIYFDVKNGVISKEVSKKPTVELAKVLNPTNTTEATTGKAVADYVENKDLIIAELGNNKSNFFYYNKVSLTNTEYIGNNVIIPKDSTLIELRFNVNEVGNVIFAIGKKVGNVFNERKTIEITSVIGENIVLQDLGVLEGESILYKTPVLSIGVVENETNGISKENNVFTSTPFGINLSFKIKYKNGEIEKLFEVSNLETYGSLIKSFYYGGGSLDDVKYIGMNKIFSTEKIIKKLDIDLKNAGVLTMALGIKDQNEKFIERKKIEFDASGGSNSFLLSEKLLKNEFFLIRSPHLIHGVNIEPENDVITQIYFNQNGGVARYSDYSAAYSFEVGDLPKIDNSIKEDVQELRNEIAVLSVKKDAVLISDTGKKYKLGVIDNNGTPTINLKYLDFNRITVLGNSITKHPITSFWWGNWGMSASEQSKDFVHQFLNLMLNDFPTAQISAQNISAWETNLGAYDKSNIDLSIDPTLIVLKVGENVNNLQDFENEFSLLIDYLQTQKPNATILVGGLFFPNQQKDTSMFNVCNSKNLTFVHLSDLYTEQYKSFIGAVVKGEDGEDHIIDNEGVANHPSDIGMLEIGKRLYNAL